MRHPLLIGDEASDKRLLQIENRGKYNTRQANRALTVAIIALLLGTLGTVAAFAYGISWGNLIQNNAQVSNNQYQMLNAEILELIMNTSSSYNVTTVQVGTFVWTNGFTSAPTGDYRVKHVQFGEILGFDVLEIDPPSTPITFVGATPYAITMESFNPLITQFITPGSGLPNTGAGFISLPMTSSNLGKISVNDPCLGLCTGFPVATGACCETSSTGDITPSATAANAFRVFFTYASPSSYYLGIFFITDNPTALFGKEFTISSPWTLVLPVV